MRCRAFSSHGDLYQLLRLKYRVQGAFKYIKNQILEDLDLQKMIFIKAIAFIVTVAMALPADAPLATSSATSTTSSEPEGGRGGEGPCCRPCGGGVGPHICCYC